MLIFGAPRSGTTWAAKILDSHPAVLYRHEPDITRQSGDLPLICPAEEHERYRAPMREYARALLETRSVKAAGSAPVFPKAYDTPWTRAARPLTVRALRNLERVLPRQRRHWVQIPDLGRPLYHPETRPLIKSVSGLGRIGLVLDALPTCRVVLILREPWGQIASRLRGLQQGRFERTSGFDRRWLAAPAAQAVGLDPDRLDQAPLAERLAWDWVVKNATAIAAMRGHARARLLRYEDMLAEPITHARALFDFAELSWHETTERFIRTSTTYRGRERYYRVYRNAEAQKTKWRRVIDPETERIIRAVLEEARPIAPWIDPACDGGMVPLRAPAMSPIPSVPLALAAG